MVFLRGLCEHRDAQTQMESSITLRAHTLSAQNDDMLVEDALTFNLIEDEEDIE